MSMEDAYVVGDIVDLVRREEWIEARESWKAQFRANEEYGACQQVIDCVEEIFILEMQPQLFPEETVDSHLRRAFCVWC
jgi:hypothetical protein